MSSCMFVDNESEIYKKSASEVTDGLFQTGRHGIVLFVKQNLKKLKFIYMTKFPKYAAFYMKKEPSEIEV